MIKSISEKIPSPIVHRIQCDFCAYEIGAQSDMSLEQIKDLLRRRGWRLKQRAICPKCIEAKKHLPPKPDLV